MKNYVAAAWVAASTMLCLLPQAAMAQKSDSPWTTRLLSLRPTSLRPSSQRWTIQSGVASYYSSMFQGRSAANGEIFDQRKLTAAHPWLPFGTQVRVTRPDTGRSIIVTITDRIYYGHRILDLSLSAARKLDMLHQGLAKVRLAPV
jgi:rare lipoprotein A